MRKILLIILFILIFTGNTCSAKIQPKERISLPSFSNEMTKSEYATLYYADNNNEEAFSYLLSIKEEERTAQNWLLIGNILQDNGKIADAIFMYDRAISTDKKFYKAYYNLANIYLDENKFNMAISNYKLAIKYNPEFAYAYYNMGCAYLNLGQIKKAKYAFLKAVELKNTVPEFHYNLAYIYKKLGKENISIQYLENYNQIMLGY